MLSLEGRYCKHELSQHAPRPYCSMWSEDARSLWISSDSVAAPGQSTCPRRVLSCNLVQKRGRRGRGKGLKSVRKRLTASIFSIELPVPGFEQPKGLEHHLPNRQTRLGRNKID